MSGVAAPSSIRASSTQPGIDPAKQARLLLADMRPEPSALNDAWRYWDGTVDPSKYRHLPPLKVDGHFNVRHKGYDDKTALVMAALSEVVYDAIDSECDVDRMAAQLARMGFRLPYTVNERFLSEGRQSLSSDTQAMVLENDDCYVAVIRGSESFSDLLTGLWGAVSRTEAFGGKVHSGFYESFLRVRPDYEVIKEHFRQHGAKPIYITGHSLGAAIATLIAADMVAHGLPVEGVYLYGSPRVGNVDFASSYDALKMPDGRKLGDVTFPHANSTDIVTNLLPPGKLLPFDFMPRWYKHVASKNNRYFDHRGNEWVGLEREGTIRMLKRALQDWDFSILGSMFKKHRISDYVAAKKRVYERRRAASLSRARPRSSLELAPYAPSRPLAGLPRFEGGSAVLAPATGGLAAARRNLDLLNGLRGPHLDDGFDAPGAPASVPLRRRSGAGAEESE